MTASEVWRGRMLRGFQVSHALRLIVILPFLIVILVTAALFFIPVFLLCAVMPCFEPPEAMRHRRRYF